MVVEVSVTVDWALARVRRERDSVVVGEVEGRILFGEVRLRWLLNLFLLLERMR